MANIRAGVRKVLSIATRKAKHHRSWHGVSIVRGGRIIVDGYNFEETHAEAHAFQNADWVDKLGQCKGATLVSMRLAKSGRIACAKPCDDCMVLIRKYGIRFIVYSDAAGMLHRERVV